MQIHINLYLSGKVLLPEHKEKHHKTPVAILCEHARENIAAAQHTHIPHCKQLKKYINFLCQETSNTEALGLFQTRIP